MDCHIWTQPWRKGFSVMARGKVQSYIRRSEENDVSGYLLWP